MLPNLPDRYTNTILYSKQVFLVNAYCRFSTRITSIDIRQADTIDEKRSTENVIAEERNEI